MLSRVSGARARELLEAQDQPVRQAGHRDVVEFRPVECGPACPRWKHSVNSSS